jgi:UDP-N-acetylmuramoylalanine-D-glutamate ligase
MAGHIGQSLRRAGFSAIAFASGIPEAVERALRVPDATVVFSPGCGTGSLFPDKYARGEAFDEAATKLVPDAQTAR